MCLIAGLPCKTLAMMGHTTSRKESINEVNTGADVGLASDS